MAKNWMTEQVKKEFRERESFSREELFSFFRKFEPDLKETTFRWRIYDLKNRKVITSISKRLFTLIFKPVFKPDSGEIERNLFSKIENRFPTLKFCVWSTKIVNELMLHIPARPIIILMVEKEALEPVYDFLKEQNFGNLFIQPEEKEIERYIFESESAIILNPLVSKSPIQKVNRVTTTTLEKLIVDLYSDKLLFASFQGNELAYLINTAFNRYSIDFTKLFHYAKRRNKEIDLLQFLSDKTDIPKNILND
ncbi:MAG: hypothetical protein LCH54_13680 [Bacteroidetes bacterium]|nr:hypothetical protein [Bacteroidota bacterium]